MIQPVKSRVNAGPAAGVGSPVVALVGREVLTGRCTARRLPQFLRRLSRIGALARAAEALRNRIGKGRVIHMRVAIIGTGSIAGVHARALAALGHTVRAVVSRTQPGAEAFVLAHADACAGATAGTAIETALADDIDAVHICTPPALHGAAVRTCLDAGKHIVCEKPLCLAAAEAESLAALAKQRALVAALCLNVRYYPANRAAAERIRSGGIGRPLLIHGEYLQAFHAPPHADGWRFDPALGGHMRAITEIGTHWADLASFWTGERIEAVCAALGNFYPTRYRHGRQLTLEKNDRPVVTDTEDAAAVVLRFANGAIGTVLLSEVSRGHENDLSIEVAGESGSAAWREAQPDALLSSGKAGMERESFRPIAREDTFLPLFEAAYADMMRPAARRAGGYPTFLDGAYLARVCEAIQKSAADGCWMHV